MLSVGGSACHVGTPKTVSVCIYSNLLEEGMRVTYMYACQKQAGSVGALIPPAYVGRQVGSPDTDTQGQALR